MKFLFSVLVTLLLTGPAAANHGAEVFKPGDLVHATLACTAKGISRIAASAAISEIEIDRAVTTALNRKECFAGQGSGLLIKYHFTFFDYERDGFAVWEVDFNMNKAEPIFILLSPNPDAKSRILNRGELSK